MTNPDETTKSEITETGPDTIEARGSDGETILGMTWGEFEKRIAQSTEFREALEMQHFDRNNANYEQLFDAFLKDYIRKIDANPLLLVHKNQEYIMAKGTNPSEDSTK
jgi:hypothetical protein